LKQPDANRKIGIGNCGVGPKEDSGKGGAASKTKKQMRLLGKREKRESMAGQASRVKEVRVQGNEKSGIKKSEKKDRGKGG